MKKRKQEDLSLTSGVSTALYLKYLIFWSLLMFVDIAIVECCIFVNNCFIKDSFLIFTKRFKLASATHSYNTRSVRSIYTKLWLCQIQKKINYPLNHSNMEPSTRWIKEIWFSLSITKKPERFTTQIFYIYL